MARQLPLICIAGTAFYIDVVKEQLREYGDPDNHISFNCLQGEGDHYMLEWNKAKKTVFIKDAAGHDSKDLVIVRIPPIVRLDPFGLALKYHKPLHVFMAMKDDTQW